MALGSAAHFLLALFKVRSVNLAELATGFGGQAQVDSHYKRLQRFFRSFEIDLVGCRKSFDRLRILRWLGGGISGLEGRVKPFEFSSGHLVTELPMDFSLELVTWVFPRSDFFAQDVEAGDAPS